MHHIMMDQMPIWLPTLFFIGGLGIGLIIGRMK